MAATGSSSAATWTERSVSWPWVLHGLLAWPARRGRWLGFRVGGGGGGQEKGAWRSDHEPKKCGCAAGVTAVCRWSVWSRRGLFVSKPWRVTRVPARLVGQPCGCAAASHGSPRARRPAGAPQHGSIRGHDGAGGGGGGGVAGGGVAAVPSSSVGPDTHNVHAERRVGSAA